MKKIPTIFERDWDGDRSRVIDKPHPDCGWVFAGEGVATRKLDGTSCMIRDGKLYKRREVKKGQPYPANFTSEGLDMETGKSVGWVPVTPEPEDQYHREAFGPGGQPDGTYELLGPKIQGNVEKFDIHILVQHGSGPHYDAPRTFEALRDWLTGKDIEGLVWHHPDGRMAKLKLRDFGLKRPAKAPAHGE